MNELRKVAKNTGLLTGAEWIINNTFQANWPSGAAASGRSDPHMALRGVIAEGNVKHINEMTIAAPFDTPDWLYERREEIVRSVFGRGFDLALDETFGKALANPQLRDIRREAERLVNDDAHGYGRRLYDLKCELEHRQHSSRWTNLAHSLGIQPDREGSVSYLTDADPRRVIIRGIKSLLICFLAFAAAGQEERTAIIKPAVEMLRTHVPICEDKATPGTWFVLKL